MNTLQKTVLMVGVLSVLVCYLLSVVLTFLHSNGAFYPTTARAGVVAPSK